MVQYRDLVAGNGEKGYRDGPFYLAEFNQPMGMALNADGSILYVADQKNNLIRAVLFKEKNKVITVAGSLSPGRADGPLTLSSFNQPKDLAYLPNDQIAVFDQGDLLLRIIDLKKGTVSTLAGGADPGQAEGEGLKVKLGPLWDLVYYDQDHCLYFSLPDAGLLQKLDPGSGVIKTVLKDNPRLPHPQALCVADRKLYIADRDNPDVFEFNPSAFKKKPSDNPGPALKQVGRAPGTITGLAGSAKCLYACLNKPDCPVFRFFPNAGPLSFPSGFGFTLSLPVSKFGHSYSSPGELLAPFQASPGCSQAGFIFNAQSDDQFYLTNPNLSFIASIRDNTTSHVLADTDFPSIGSPYSKPPGTFRILVLGRSAIDAHTDSRFFWQPEKANEESWEPLMSLPKYLEVELNTQAALEDYPAHFEVVSKNGRFFNLLDESYWNVPQICVDDGVDLVLIMLQSSELRSDLDYLVTRPVDSDGIPAKTDRPEFLMKPIKERFPAGIYKDFLQYVIDHKMVNPVNDTYWIFSPGSFDSEAWDLFEKILSQPLKMLKKKMEGIRTSGGKAPQLVVCYFPFSNHVFSSQASDGLGVMDPQKNMEKDKSFWVDLCQKEGFTFLDSSDDFSVIGMSYQPLGIDHFHEDGMALWARILAHELSQNNLIPAKELSPLSNH